MLESRQGILRSLVIQLYHADLAFNEALSVQQTNKDSIYVYGSDCIYALEIIRVYTRPITSKISTSPGSINLLKARADLTAWCWLALNTQAKATSTQVVSPLNLTEVFARDDNQKRREWFASHVNLDFDSTIMSATAPGHVLDIEQLLFKIIVPIFSEDSFAALFHRANDEL